MILLFPKLTVLAKIKAGNSLVQFREYWLESESYVFPWTPCPTPVVKVIKIYKI